MKLISDKTCNSADFMRHQYQCKDKGVHRDKFPQNSAQIAFGAKIPEISAVSGIIGKFKGTAYELTKEQCSVINKALGDNFFMDTLSKGGYDTNASSLTFKQTKFSQDLFETVKYPFHDMWLDIAASFVKNPKKDGIIAKHLEKTEAQKSRQLVMDIVSQFDKENPDDFINSTARNISKSPMNYRTRDERTLNRMLTSTVSAIYSANDFYNISMLQKDSDDEAKKAQKSRLRQELSRMALSAGLTFVTMGALDKRIKNNMYLSALSIAISALISEAGSRLLSKTPLHPLSPAEAKKYAAKKDINKNEDNSSAQQSTQTEKTDTVSFKASGSEKIFKDFARNDGTFASLQILRNNKADDISEEKNKEPKKKMSPKKIAIAAVTIASMLQILSKTKAGVNVSKYIKQFEDFITSKKEVINQEQISLFREELLRFKDVDEALVPVIEKYEAMLDNTKSLELKSSRFLISGLYNGFTKIFKTVYTILSAPGNLAIKAWNKLTNKPQVVSNSSKKADDKALAELYRIFRDNKGNDEKIIETIKKRTRNFEENIETGELANFSRTLVTAITTYFFVNDYRNRVLIESKGEDIEGAQFETRQRLGHKLANFIINGTIMNVGNSVFKKQLNGSLMAASAIAIAEETINEALVRKSTCQPIAKKHSRQEIIDFEEEQLNKKGLMGAWSRLFRKITGKRTLSQKAGISADGSSSKQDNK